MVIGLCDKMTMKLGSTKVAAKRRTLPAALAAHRWHPGQSGNPANTARRGDFARQAAPDAVRRLIELTRSEDERVAAVACNGILDRAFGKPKEFNPAEGSFDYLTDGELNRRIVEELVRAGIPEKKARGMVRGDRAGTPFSQGGG